MGNELAQLTRKPGLRTMLRMMRKPAHAAGMGALQQFLESGFDTFGQLARQRGAVEQFREQRTGAAILTEKDPNGFLTERGGMARIHRAKTMPTVPPLGPDAADRDGAAAAVRISAPALSRRAARPEQRRVLPLWRT